MSSVYLADTLVAAVREEGLIPASNEASLLLKVRRILNREQRLYLAAFLQKAREEFQTDSLDIDTVAGTTDYVIPTLAVGSAIRRVETVTGSSVGLLWPVDPVRNLLSGAVGDYHLLGAKIRLVATPTVAGTLRVVYAKRFNRVVAAAECGEISAINTGTKQVTCLHPDTAAATVPSTFTSAKTYDFIQGTPHFQVIAAAAAATTVASNVITFTATLPAGLAVGDFVALKGETPIVNAPLEVQDVLVLKAAHSYLSGVGNAANAALVMERLTQAEKDALLIISPRVKDTPPLVMNYSGPGWARGLARRRRF